MYLLCNVYIDDFPHPILSLKEMKVVNIGGEGTGRILEEMGNK
jgi:hypothetical protein